MFPASAIQVAEGINVGAVVIAALREAQIAQKEAAILCGVDQPAFTRGLLGERPLDLWRLRHLPPRFWRAFFERFASEKIREWWAGEELPLRMAKAQLLAAEQKRSA